MDNVRARGRRRGYNRQTLLRACVGSMAKHRPVQVLIKPASADCNLACRYCFYLPKAELYPETRIHRMPPDVHEEMIRQILRYGGDQPAFAYQGGEPTLMGLDYFRRAVDLQQTHGKPGQTICNSVQTNGILIDEEWGAFLSRYKFLVGLSLDGPAHVHDHYRLDLGGRPTHARVARAAQTLRECDAAFNVLAVVTRYAAAFATEIYAYFRENGWDYLQFIPAVEVDRATGRLADFSVPPLDYGRFMCKIFDHWKQDFRDGRPTVSIRLFDTLLGLYCNLSPPSCTFRRTCGIYVVIEYNGDVYSCDFFVEPHWKLGNLMHQSLRALLEGPRQREFGALKAQTPERCAECPWLPLCRGGCLKDRARSQDGADAPFAKEFGLDYFCEANRMIFQHTQSTFLELKRIYEADRACGSPTQR